MEEKMTCPKELCEYYIDKEKSYRCLKLEKGMICGRRYEDYFKPRENV